jgi:hypothetical protein
MLQGVQGGSSSNTQMSSAEDTGEGEDAAPQLLHADTLLQPLQQQQQQNCTRSIREFADVLSRALSGAAAAAAYAAGSGTSSSTASQQPPHHNARSISVAATPCSVPQYSSTSVASAATPNALSASGCLESRQDVNQQDWPAAHKRAPAAATVVPNSHIYHPQVMPLVLPIDRCGSSNLARYSSIGTAVLVPTEPANIFEASIAARPNFEARELPPSCYWYQVVNALILCVLLAGTVIELVTGEAL